MRWRLLHPTIIGPFAFLSARTLDLGEPIVTAFHVIRMSALVLTIGPLFRSMRYFQVRADA